MIQVVQKLIKIGSSEGVTIPRKEIVRLGARRGDELKLTIETINKPSLAKHAKLMREYDSFVQQYGSTLKNLAKR